MNCSYEKWRLGECDQKAANICTVHTSGELGKHQTLYFGLVLNIKLHMILFYST